MPIKKTTVEEQYGKDKELRREDVLALMDWAEKQPHLPKLTELQIVLFLHSCYFSSETAKTTIDNFCTLKSHVGEFFKNRDPEKLRQHLNIVSYTILNRPTKEGYSIFYSRIMDFAPDKYVTTEQYKLVDMLILLEYFTNGIRPGLVVVIDMQGTTLGHLARINILTVKKFLYYVQEALPVRLKKVIIMNALPIVDKFLTVFKPFMKKSLLDMMSIHQDLESMYEHVPQECLPKEFGGNSGTLEEMQKNYIKIMLENRDFFLEEEKQNDVDESKRQGKPKNLGEIFGVEGTFKKLSID